MRSERLLVLVMAYSGLLVSMLFNLVIPLVPALPEKLHTSTADAGWVATAFFLSGAVSYAVMGRLADRYGARRMLLFCAWLLVVSSFGCALATGLGTLLVARAFQGASLPIVSISLTVLRRHVPADRLAAASGVAAAGLGLGSAIGLVGGGLLLDHLEWHSVFWFTALLALPLALVAPLVVPRDGPLPRQPLDLWGAVLLLVMVAGLLLPLSKLADWGLSAPTVVLPALTVLILPLWIRGRLRHPFPVVDVRALRRAPLVATHVGAMAAGYCGFMTFIVTTNLLQDTGPDGFGLSLTVAGLCMTPAAVSFLITGPLTGRVLDRVGLRRTYVVAGLVSAGAAVAAAVLPTSVVGLSLLGLLAYVGNGMYLASLPVGTATFADLGDIGSTNGVNALARTTGLAFASGAFALISDALPETATEQVLVVGEVTAAGVALAATAVTLWAVPRRRAVSPGVGHDLVLDQ